MRSLPHPIYYEHIAHRPAIAARDVRRGRPRYALFSNPPGASGYFPDVARHRAQRTQGCRSLETRQIGPPLTDHLAEPECIGKEDGRAGPQHSALRRSMPRPDQQATMARRNSGYRAILSLCPACFGGELLPAVRAPPSPSDAGPHRAAPVRWPHRRRAARLGPLQRCASCRGRDRA